MNQTITMAAELQGNGVLRELYNKGIYDRHSSPDVIAVIKSRRSTLSLRRRK